MNHAVTGDSRAVIEWELPYAYGRQIQAYYLKHHRGRNSTSPLTAPFDEKELAALGNHG